MKYYVEKIENGYRLVRDEMNNGFLVPYAGIVSKYKLVDRKSKKAILSWCEKKGFKIEGIIE